jgi:hypothetical protein
MTTMIMQGKPEDIQAQFRGRRFGFLCQGGNSLLLSPLTSLDTEAPNHMCKVDDIELQVPNTNTNTNSHLHSTFELVSLRVQ